MTFPLNWARLVITAIPMAVIAFAGLSKLLDVESFVESLHSWEIVPRRLAAPIAVFLPATEAFVGVGWFIGLSRDRLASAALVLLCCFTAAYAIEWAVAGPPDCNCLGPLLAHTIRIDGIENVLARNGVLIFALVVGKAVRVVAGRRGATRKGAGPPVTEPVPVQAE